jgi:lactate dehydrogenase-like 2-hydroxyacid dehydrogenase
LTEDWGETLFAALKKAGGHAYSNMAVGYNNVDVNAATRHGIAVGNTPVCHPTTSCKRILHVIIDPLFLVQKSPLV